MEINLNNDNLFFNCNSTSETNFIIHPNSHPKEFTYGCCEGILYCLNKETTYYLKNSEWALANQKQRLDFIHNGYMISYEDAQTLKNTSSY